MDFEDSLASGNSYFYVMDFFDGDFYQFLLPFFLLL